MNEKINEMKIAKLRTSKNRLHQTDARDYKADLHELFIAKLEELDVMITEVQNGFIIEMPHDELGSIPIEAKFVIKQLDYDVITAGEMFQEKKEKPKKKE